MSRVEERSREDARLLMDAPLIGGVVAGTGVLTGALLVRVIVGTGADVILNCDVVGAGVGS